MLLSNFSWQVFLLAAVLLSLLWYAGVWLLFYRKKPAGASAPLPHGWEDEVDVLEGANVERRSGDLVDDLMGLSALAHGVSVLEAEDFSFGVPEETKLGVLPDVQEEIKTACRAVEAGVGGKPEFFALFALIRERYAIPQGSRELLNEFIREHVPFFLAEQELEDLWL